MSGKSIYWILQNKTDVPTDDDWLSTNEKLILQGLKFPKRRGEWRLGRWTAKQLIHSCFKLINNSDYEFPDLEVLPTEDGSPQVFLQGKSYPVKISISHRASVGFCVLSLANGSIGCDLELIEERSDAFISDYFTYEEKLKVIVAGDEEKPILANLIWSAKESVLKVLRQGLNSDTRSVIVDVDTIQIKEGWNEIRAKSLDINKNFWGWWQKKEKYILTIYSVEPTSEPKNIST